MSSERTITTPELHQAMEDLDNAVLTHDTHELSTIVSAMQQLSAMMRVVLSRLQYLQTTPNIVMERTSVLLSRLIPKSSCIFCTVEENRDSHYYGRCMKCADPFQGRFKLRSLNCRKSIIVDT
ncbi:unnamed protein product [Nippostrongylus brasiliensis]|uniref:Nuclear receptor domain-containing protein n=1 Tax=Nippostrongylus brasiliensis TaxID=27835 RepID=A0A0N4YB30_NIPBR|nr:unnamed protein product [Nippostrongylus brasiliensis]